VSPTATSIYIASPEGETGKSTIALGLLRRLSALVPKVGVFRPITRREDRDYILELLLAHSDAGLSYEDYLAFCQNADLLIHDAEYTPEEYDNQIDWGHSVYTDALSLAIEANVTTLGLFHLNQNRTDRQMDAILDHCYKIIEEKAAPLQCVAVDCSMSFEL